MKIKILPYIAKTSQGQANFRSAADGPVGQQQRSRMTALGSGATGTEKGIDLEDFADETWAPAPNLSESRKQPLIAICLPVDKSSVCDSNQPQNQASFVNNSLASKV